MKSKPLLFLDTNVFIYFFEGKEKLGLKARKIFESLEADQAKAVTSIITQVELLSLKTTPMYTQKLLELFLETPNLKVENLGPEVAVDAARIRRLYGFRTPDAIQLATAVYCKVDTFVTNDKRLLQFKEVKMKLL